jgi:hypothetical protein
MIVRLLSSESESSLGIKSLDASFRFEVPFDKHVASVLQFMLVAAKAGRCGSGKYLFVEGVGVDRRGVDMPQGFRYAALAEQMHKGMHPFLVVDVEVWWRNQRVIC